ncbi:MAG: GNAT family N-acetyltransferase [Tissierellaceae bacterium]|nr:GNAT family N-acetyltransferase [Tissierellaceae bacterium]
MFRKASMQDIDRISEIYDEIHLEEENGNTTTGWVRDVYPTRKTAEDAILIGNMFVLEDNEQIVAAAKIDQEQIEGYSNASWNYDVAKDKVMVLHTLVVSPRMKGKGYGSKFVGCYEKYALESGCYYLRMDTNERNLNARRLYKKLGYKEVSILPSVFNGIEGVKLVYLEKKLS